MQFKLTNMGRIGSADVTLNGITVIAGPNGSGKSTISRALFTWFNYLRQVREDVSQVRVMSIKEDILKSLMEIGIPNYYGSRFLSAFFGKSDRVIFLDRSFWLDGGESSDWWEGCCSMVSWPVKGAQSIVSPLYERARQSALHWIDKDEMEIAQFVATRQFAKAFDEQVGTLFDERATTEVSLESDEGTKQASFFSGGVSSALAGVGSLNGDAYKGMRMFYLEPTHMLDAVPTELRRAVRKSSDNRYSANEDLQWEEILRKDLRRQDMSFTQAERLDPIFKELDKIVSTIHGEIVRDGIKLAFKDADLPSDKTVSLMNIASGAKSMAVLVRGLRNDSIHPGDFIIIDEPESNLHPEWQVSFARFLVLLHARFGIRFLLNTHSPYFLKAIEVYSDLLEQDDDCEYYNMIKRDNGQYDAKCVTECLQDVFKAMSVPFAQLMDGE